jgi:hypothetical protein
MLQFLSSNTIELAGPVDSTQKVSPKMGMVVSILAWAAISTAVAQNCFKVIVFRAAKIGSFIDDNTRC